MSIEYTERENENIYTERENENIYKTSTCVLLMKRIRMSYFSCYNNGKQRAPVIKLTNGAQIKEYCSSLKWQPTNILYIEWLEN